MAQANKVAGIEGAGSGRIPVGVVGCGRMGRLHARTYAEMPEAHLEWVYDADPSAAIAAAHDFGCQTATHLQAMAERVKAVSIAVPTVHHLEAARPFLERGVACLIEKPLAPTSNIAREIVDLAHKHNTPLMVGHIERYNPAVRAMLELGLKPAFIEVTRISPLTFRSIDVGVVLDMMIHDIDIVQLLAKSKVCSIDATGVSVIGQDASNQRPAEDICNVRLRFENGCVANLTASRLALKTERKLRVFSADAYVSLDYQKRYGIVIRRGENLGQIRDVVRQIQVGEIEDLSQVNYAELVDVRELEMPEENGKHDPIRGQLEAFVTAVMSGSAMPTPGKDGLAAVELAEQIVQAMQRPTL